MTERRCVASLLVKFVFLSNAACPARHVSGCRPQVKRSKITDDHFNVAHTMQATVLQKGL